VSDRPLAGDQRLPASSRDRWLASGGVAEGVVWIPCDAARIQSLPPPGGWKTANEAERNECENRAKENNHDQGGLRRGFEPQARDQSVDTCKLLKNRRLGFVVAGSAVAESNELPFC